MKPDLAAIMERAERAKEGDHEAEIDIVYYITDKLLAYISELEAGRQWVSVADRLPEMGREVDVWTKTPEYNFTLHQDRIRFTNMKTTTNYHEMAFDSSEVMSPIRVRDITHWRYSGSDMPSMPEVSK